MDSFVPFLAHPRVYLGQITACSAFSRLCWGISSLRPAWEGGGEAGHHRGSEISPFPVYFDHFFSSIINFLPLMVSATFRFPPEFLFCVLERAQKKKQPRRWLKPPEL